MSVSDNILQTHFRSRNGPAGPLRIVDAALNQGPKLLANPVPESLKLLTINQECLMRLGLSKRSTTIRRLRQNPACDSFQQSIGIDRLGDKVVHPGRPASLVILLQNAGRERHNGDVG